MPKDRKKLPARSRPCPRRSHPHRPPPRQSGSCAKHSARSRSQQGSARVASTAGYHVKVIPAGEAAGAVRAAHAAGGTAQAAAQLRSSVSATKSHFTGSEPQESKEQTAGLRAGSKQTLSEPARPPSSPGHVAYSARRGAYHSILCRLQSAKGPATRWQHQIESVDQHPQPHL